MVRTRKAASEAPSASSSVEKDDSPPVSEKSSSKEPSTSNEDRENTPPGKSPKKRSKKMVIEASANQQDQLRRSSIRSGISESYRGAFEVESGRLSEMVSFYKSLKGAYTQTVKYYPNEIKSVFLDEIEVNLYYMMDGTYSSTKRFNVLQLSCLLAFRLLKEGFGDVVLQFLVDYCKEVQYSEEPVIRQNVVGLVGLLLNFGLCNQGKPDTQQFELPDNHRNELYQILLNRQLDRAPAVRAEVTKSAQMIADYEIPSNFSIAVETAPLDIILLSLCDVMADCRFTAMNSLNLNSDNTDHVTYTVNIVTSDPNVRVRIAAIRKLGTLHPGELTSAQLMDVLECTLTDCSEVIHESARTDLLGVWLPLVASQGVRQEAADESAPAKLRNHGYAVAVRRILSQLDWFDRPDIVRKIVFAMLDVARRDLCEKGRMMPVVEFIDALLEDDSDPPVIARYNCQVVINRSQNPTDQAISLFFWRCLVEYVHMRTANSRRGVPTDDSMYKLIPELVTMCDLINSFVDSDLEEAFDTSLEDLNAVNMKQICIRELLKIIRFCERESVGLARWKDLLECLAADVLNSKDVTDLIMNYLAEIHYQDRHMELLDVITSLTSRLIDQDINPDSTMMDQTVLLAHASDGGNREASEVTIVYCLQLTNSLLKTGVFKKNNPYLLTAREKMIVPHIGSEIEHVRRWAMEAMVIASFADEDFALKVTSLLLTYFQEDLKSIKLVCLDAIVDLIMNYSFELVDYWGRLANPSFESILDFFTNIIESSTEDDDILSKACECAAKILLLREREATELCFIKTVTSLILRFCHPATAGVPRLKACLALFFMSFASARRSNQLLLINAYERFISIVTSENVGDFVREAAVNSERAARLVAEYTKASSCHENEKSSESLTSPLPSPHKILLDRIVDFTTKSQDLDVLRLHFIVADSITLNHLDEPRAQEIHDIIEDLYENLLATQSSKSKVLVDIKKFMKRLTQIRRDKSVNEIQDEEGGEIVKTEIMVANTPKPKKKASAPVSRVKSVTLEDSDEEVTEILSRNNAARAHLGRAAKKAKIALFKD